MKKEETLQDIVLKLNCSLTEKLINAGCCVSFSTDGFEDLVKYGGDLKLGEDDIDWELPLLPQVLQAIRTMATTLTAFSHLIDTEFGEINETAN